MSFLLLSLIHILSNHFNGSRTSWAAARHWASTGRAEGIQVVVRVPHSCPLLFCTVLYYTHKYTGVLDGPWTLLTSPSLTLHALGNQRGLWSSSICTIHPQALSLVSSFFDTMKCSEDMGPSTRRCEALRVCGSRSNSADSERMDSDNSSTDITYVWLPYFPMWNTT